MAAEPADTARRFAQMKPLTAPRPVRQIVGGAVTGFAAGMLLAAGLLAGDAFSFAALVAAERFAPAVAALFSLGLGVVLAPAGVATALALAAAEDRPR